MAIEITKESIKTLVFEDLVAWCKENNQIEWLKSLPRTTVVKVYPTKTKVSKKDGKERQVYDRKQAPIGEKTIALPYSTVKAMFVEKFFPQFMGDSKPKAASMWDIIDSL